MSYRSGADATCETMTDTRRFGLLRNIMADNIERTFVEASEVTPPVFAGPLQIANP
ncbi:MAG: hypothetical protein Q7T11_00600 [Deltaproteobacteria bacterium]|nr:hypothetical protein [Deltaproteobacteria bacterium]